MVGWQYVVSASRSATSVAGTRKIDSKFRGKLDWMADAGPRKLGMGLNRQKISMDKSETVCTAGHPKVNQLYTQVRSPARGTAKT